MPGAAQPGMLATLPQASVSDFKKKFHGLKKAYYPSRQRFTLPAPEGARSGAALEDGKRLGDYALADGSVLIFKDLGPQVRASSCAGMCPRMHAHVLVVACERWFARRGEAIYTLLWDRPHGASGIMQTIGHSCPHAGSSG